MAHKCVAIVQSSYIPWKGYFDLIRAADEFILLDDVQFTKRDWRSRNRIKTKDGLCWLTDSRPQQGPLRAANHGHDDLPIRPGPSATGRPFTAPTHARRSSRPTRRSVRAAVRTSPSDRLSDVNRSLIEGVCQMLGITTPDQMVVRIPSARGTQRAADRSVREEPAPPTICPDRAPADTWTRPRLPSAGVTVHFVDYSGYREYPQPYPPFEHAVSASISSSAPARARVTT